jgi:DNA-binding response OmpR family regulator
MWLPDGNFPRASGHTSTPVALVGLNAEDERALSDILGCSECLCGPTCDWNILAADTVDSVLETVRRELVGIVVFDHDGLIDHWKELLDEFSAIPHAPLLIVTSRLADDRLWVEALNLGAYDVLSKPFDRAEVSRIAGLACAQWHGRQAAAMHSAA